MAGDRMNVEIRPAVGSDIENIMPMAEKFWQTMPYSEPFEYDRALDVLLRCMGCGIIAVAESDGELVGFCCGMSDLLLCSTQAKYGMEIAWWLEPHARGKGTGVELLAKTEQLAKESGVKYWTMLSMECSSPEHAARLYLLNGYEHAESSYIKVL